MFPGVYKACDPKLDRAAALKVIPTSEDISAEGLHWAERLERETQALAKVREAAPEHAAYVQSAAEAALVRLGDRLLPTVDAPLSLNSRSTVAQR